ncbi:hypothetical protein B0813_002620 [Candidatus Fervidibacteria bacterium JGI MDM2 SSWTFF-3-K9]
MKSQCALKALLNGAYGYFFSLFLTGWLIGWVEGEIFALRELGLLPQSERWTPQGFSFPFLIGWLIAWTAGGILAGYIWLRLLLLTLVGREVIVASPMSFDIVVRPIGRLRRYRLTEVCNLRVLEDTASTMTWWWYRWVMPTVGIIAFDYGASTVRFGLTIEPAEAWQIVTLLRERFGQYMAEEEDEEETED